MGKDSDKSFLVSSEIEAEMGYERGTGVEVEVWAVDTRDSLCSADELNVSLCRGRMTGVWNCCRRNPHLDGHSVAGSSSRNSMPSKSVCCVRGAVDLSIVVHVWFECMSTVFMLKL
jgi:hypothetical protein